MDLQDVLSRLGPSIACALLLLKLREFATRRGLGSAPCREGYPELEELGRARSFYPPSPTSPVGLLVQSEGEP